MIGTTIAHYRVLQKLGQGGMGEVYLAEDLSLKRRVALKVLPPAFARDAERLARFEREAEAVAALNHPNIVTIHSVNESGGVRFLTMELVEGEALDRLIPEGGMAIGDLLVLAVTLADAVAAAHDCGITHRDLKPANIMVDRKGRLKVLDFGLAKQQLASPQASEETNAAVTAGGDILGTTPYMSPEQVKGQSADHRSDIFALGILLFEMATGERPFKGGTPAEVMTAIIRDTPPAVVQLRPGLPRQLDRIVRHCLARDPDARFQSAHDLKNELQDLRREIESGDVEGPDAPRPAPGPRRAALPAMLAAGAMATAAVVWYLWAGGPSAPPRESAATSATAVRRLSQLTFSGALEEWPAWAPDGSRIVHSAEVRGFKHLEMLTLDGSESKQLTSGDRDHIQAGWIPAADAIVFVRSSSEGLRLEPGDVLGSFGTGGEIWRMDLDAGAGSARRLVADAFSPAFSPDGQRLAFDASWAGPRRIWITDGNGINPKQATTDTSEAVSHTSPSWSPDGQYLAFRRVEHTRSDIFLLDTVSEAIVGLTNDVFPDLHPVWSPDGGHVYFSSYRGGGGINIWRVPVARGAAAGPPEQVTTGAGNDLQLAFAPGGDRLAFTVLQQNADIWRLPVNPVTGAATGAPEPFISTTREDSRAAWAPDGTRLAFNSDRSGDMNLWVKSLADGRERQVTRGPGGDYQPHWSPDSRTLAFFSSRSGAAEIWTVDVDRGQLRQLTSAPGLDINPAFSPDGRQIAFHSDRNGRTDVWMMDADGSNQRQVSSTGAGGHFVEWTKAGRSVIYRDGSYFQGTVTRLALETGAVERLPAVRAGAHISLAPDEKRIIDATDHKILWAFQLMAGPALKVFEFPDANVRIDYPRWSPDGRWVSFDRTDPRGGDIWILEGVGKQARRP